MFPKYAEGCTIIIISTHNVSNNFLMIWDSQSNYISLFLYIMETNILKHPAAKRMSFLDARKLSLHTYNSSLFQLKVSNIFIFAVKMAIHLFTNEQGRCQ